MPLVRPSGPFSSRRQKNAEAKTQTEGRRKVGLGLLLRRVNGVSSSVSVATNLPSSGPFEVDVDRLSLTKPSAKTPAAAATR